MEPLGVLGSFEELLAREFDAAVLFDVPFGATTYRVFLLPGALQVDLSVTPCAAFRPHGPRFELLFGSAGNADPVAAPELRPLVGEGVHHLLHARVALRRGRTWLALHWIDELRHAALAIACVARGLPARYGRGADELPADVLAAFATSVPRDVRGDGLARALRATAEVFAGEARRAGAIDARLEGVLDDVLADLR